MSFFSGQVYTKKDVDDQIDFQRRVNNNAVTTILEDIFAPGATVEVHYAEDGIQNTIEATIVSFTGDNKVCNMELFVKLVGGAYMLLKLTDTNSVVLKSKNNTGLCA